MTGHDLVLFCTRCRSFTEIHQLPVPYLIRCPTCGYVAKPFRRNHYSGEMRNLKGIILAIPGSKFWTKLFRLSQEEPVIQLFEKSEHGV